MRTKDLEPPECETVPDFCESNATVAQFKTAAQYGCDIPRTLGFPLSLNRIGIGVVMP